MTKRAYRGDGSLTRDAINVLDCAECGIWFPTFERLAIHVANHHDPLLSKRQPAPTPAPLPVESPAMAKKTARTTTAPRATRGGRIPAPSGDAQSSFSPFLKAENIGDVGTRGTITLKGEPRVVDGDFGEQIVIPVRFKGTQYDWGVTIDSVNHRMLHDRFGANSKKWAGPVKVTVKLSRQGRNYIAVER